MRLTTFSDYSLRVLIYLGGCARQRAVIGEIADAYDIPKNQLLKVILFLTAEGYVGTTRGKGGGVWLKADPGDIRLGELVHKSESSSALVECFAPAPSNCRLERSCLLRGAFREAVQAFYAVLDTYTLADQKALRRKLGITPPPAGSFG